MTIEPKLIIMGLVLGALVGYWMASKTSKKAGV